MKDVIVIGGGITGLATGFWLSRDGYDILLVESSPRLGGNIQSSDDPKFPFEQGPNTLLDNRPITRKLLDDLNLESCTVEASDVAADRLLYVSGRLKKASPSPWRLLRILGLWGFLRLLLEPLIPMKKVGDESIATFFDRRIGTRARRRLVDAFIGGIYAGNSTKLSMQSCFPRVLHALREHGSLYRALRAMGGTARARTISFKQGMQQWPQSLSNRIPEQQQWLEARATAINRADDGFIVTTEKEGRTDEVRTHQVVICTPAPQAAELLTTLWNDEGIKALRQIPYSPVVTMGLSWPSIERVRSKVDAFGFLAPRQQGLRILGSVFVSSIFPHAYPKKRISVNVFMGGSADPHVCDLSDESLTEIASQELSKVFHSTITPQIHSIRRWPLGIPQLTIGHADRLKHIRSAEEKVPGIFLAGNYLEGVSLHDAIASGKRVTEAFRKNK